MCMPPLETDPARARIHFDHVRAMYDSLLADGYPIDTLSMGTTGDMQAAIDEADAYIARYSASS